MKTVAETWCIQIDITNKCERRCSNCHHLTGYAAPWEMTYDQFVTALDSLHDWPKNISLIGGNPVLHSQFPLFVSTMRARVPRRLMTCFVSEGPARRKYRRLLRDSFGYLQVNPHSPPCQHQPVLCAAEDLIKNEEIRQAIIDNCWIADKWSPSITPMGAYRCEVMAAMDMALQLGRGKPPVPGWWRQPNEYFRDQFEFCQWCSAAIPLDPRADKEGIDDITQGNVQRFANCHRVRDGRINLLDPSTYDMADYAERWRPHCYTADKVARDTTEEHYQASVRRLARGEVALSVQQTELMPKPTKVRRGFVGLTCCVQCDDVFALTINRWTDQLDHIFVVTAPWDEKTIQLVSRYRSITTKATNVFYENGCLFNKGRAINIGLNALRERFPDTWIIIFDVDIFISPAMVDELLTCNLQRRALYGAYRRQIGNLETLGRVSAAWDLITTLPRMRDREIAGYFQLFHSQCPAMRSSATPYGESWRTAAGCDSEFMAKFRRRCRVRLPFDVGHLGEAGANWCGRLSSRWDSSSASNGIVSLDAIREAKTLQDLGRQEGLRNAIFQERLS